MAKIHQIKHWCQKLAQLARCWQISHVISELMLDVCWKWWHVWLILHQEPHSKHVWMVQIALNPTVSVVKIHSTTGGLNFEILISRTYLEYLSLNELKLLLNKMNLCYQFLGLCFGDNWKKHMWCWCWCWKPCFSSVWIVLCQHYIYIYIFK